MKEFNRMEGRKISWFAFAFTSNAANQCVIEVPKELP